MAFEDYVTIRCFACGGPYHPADAGAMPHLSLVPTSVPCMTAWKILPRGSGSREFPHGR